MGVYDYKFWRLLIKKYLEIFRCLIDFESVLCCDMYVILLILMLKIKMIADFVYVIYESITCFCSDSV